MSPEAPVPRREDPRMHTVEMAALPATADIAEALGVGLPDRPPVRLRTVALLVAAGGAAGSLARYGLELLLPVTFTPTLAPIPWPTGIANVIGCLGIGVLAGRIEVRPGMPRWVHPLLGTGFCGGFTTMSALVLQVAAMIGADYPAHALAYGLGSAILALAAVSLGLWIGHVTGRRR